MKIILNEEEKNQISSQHEEIDSRLFNFLIRRVKKEEKKIGNYNFIVDWEDSKPLIITEYRFEGLPGYGFNSFASKKEMEKKIIEMLYENDIIDYLIYDLNEQDPKRVKTIKTIRKFINFILPKKN